MATMITQYPGNPALKECVWTLTVAEVKAAAKLLDVHRGSYWERQLVQPLRRAVRAKAETVHISTAGFSTSDFSNVLANCGITVDRACTNQAVPYCVVFRTGTPHFFQWHRGLPMAQAKALHAREVLESLGCKAYIERYDRSLSIGLPDTYAGE
jgi:hypothetical protein